MARQLIKTGGLLVFEEKVVDGDGDPITVDHVELDSINGVKQTGGDRTPSFLSYSVANNSLASGASEALITVEIDPSGVSTNVTYTWELLVSGSSVSRFRTVPSNFRPEEGQASHVFAVLSGEDTTHKGIHKLSGNGQKERKVGTVSGWTSGEIEAACDDLGNLAVLYENTLVGYDAFGNQRWTNLDVAQEPVALEFGTDGFFYAVTDVPRVWKVNTNGQTAETFSIPGGEGNRGNRGLVPLEDGRLWLSYEDTAWLLDKEGQQIFDRFRGSNRGLRVAGRNGGSFLLVSRDDNLYAWDDNGDEIFAFGSSFDGNHPLAVAPSADVFIHADEDRVEGYRLDGTQRFDVQSTSSFTARYAYADEDNKFYLLGGKEFDDRSIMVKLDEDGNTLWVDAFYFDRSFDNNIAVPRPRG